MYNYREIYILLLVFINYCMITVVTVFYYYTFFIISIYYYIVKYSILFQQQSSTDFQFTVIGELASIRVNMLSLSPCRQQPTTSDIGPYFYLNYSRKAPKFGTLSFQPPKSNHELLKQFMPLFLLKKRSQVVYCLYVYNILK